MGAVNIPNQPIQFAVNSVSQLNGCLNNDQRAYAPLMQDTDQMQVQLINTPCSTFLGCDWSSYPDQVDEGELSQTLLGGVWFEWNTTTGTNLGIPTSWTQSSNGASNPTASNNIALAQTLPGTGGDVFLISFEATFNSASVSFRAGFLNTATNAYNDAQLDNIFVPFNETNIDGRFCVIVQSIGATPTLVFRDFALNDVTINNVVAYNLTANGLCFVPNTPISSANFWQYVESVNGFQLMFYNASNNNITTSSSLVLNNHYKITFSIMNSTDGEIYVNNSGGTFYTANGNGDYTVYYTHNVATGAISFTSNSLFDGIIYDIVIEEMCYDHTFEVLDSDLNPISQAYDASDLTYPITYYQDRLVWKFQLNNLTDPDGYPLVIENGCYYLRVTDCCTSEQRISTNFINYSTTGWDCSFWVEGNNDGFAFGFFFSDPSTATTFKLVQRLRVLQFNPVYPAVSEEYLFSNGGRSRSFAQSSKIRTAWFDYVDELTHDVIRLQILSDDLIINGAQYFCEAEDYEPEWGQNGRYNLAQSRVNLIDVNEPTLYNKSC
ncbi:MAG: hypothetical protein ACK528_11075 [Alphaproteobacteria bacterium]